MLRLLRSTLAVVAGAAGIVLVGAVSNGAAACGGGSVGCSTPAVDGNVVTVTVTGSLVGGGQGGSPGSSSTTTVSVPTPCYYTPGMTGAEYYEFQQDPPPLIAKERGLGGYTPHPGWRGRENDDQGRYYSPTCSGTNAQFGEDWDEFFDLADEYFEENETVYVEAGEDPPIPPIPPEVLLAAAQEAMEVPEPTFEHNPKDAGDVDTLVNLDTWFWLEDPTQEGSVTATAGPNSVTVDATLADVTFSSPTSGTTACQGTGTEWSPAATSDCTLTFERAGATEVTADTQWDLEWSYNGEPQAAIDPIVGTFTQPLLVAESQALVDEVG